MEGAGRVMRVAVCLGVALLAAVMVSVGVARPPKTAQGGYAARSGTPLDERQVEVSPPPPRRGRAAVPTVPSHYWLLERRYVALQHEEGRLGAEVRRLRRERLGLLRERRSFHMKARALQAASDPLTAEAHAVIAGLVCIHGGEGSWTDTGSPYWGGLQMDENFQANYAPKRLRALGTADHWTPLEQLAVGVIGWSLQGHWAPWPRTSRACGLQ